MNYWNAVESHQLHPQSVGWCHRPRRSGTDRQIGKFKKTITIFLKLLFHKKKSLKFSILTTHHLVRLSVAFARGHFCPATLVQVYSAWPGIYMLQTSNTCSLSSHINRWRNVLTSRYTAGLHFFFFERHGSDRHLSITFSLSYWRSQSANNKNLFYCDPGVPLQIVSLTWEFAYQARSVSTIQIANLLLFSYTLFCKLKFEAMSLRGIFCQSVFVFWQVNGHLHGKSF